MALTLRLLERFVVFAVLWWVLAEGDSSSWLFGIPFSLLASAASLKLTPERGWRVRVGGALRFGIFFVRNSVVGGVDVALRALRPSMPLSPGFVACPMRLPTESARVFLANTLSLLPGTLSAGFERDGTLVLHVLDCRLPVREDTGRAERYIADMLALELRTQSESSGRGEDA